MGSPLHEGKTAMTAKKKPAAKKPKPAAKSTAVAPAKAVRKKITAVVGGSTPHKVPRLPKIEWLEKTVKVAQLRPFEKNPRQISEEDLDRLRTALREDGYHQRVIATQDLRVIGGHQRIKIFVEEGFEEIQVLVPNRKLTDEEFRRILIRDNFTYAEWDKEILRAEFTPDELLDFGAPEKWLLSVFETDDEDAKDGLTDPDHVPDEDEVPVTKAGDIWLLGKHRVMCGDSVNLAHVDKLLEGKPVDMVFTDPPWNVNYGDVKEGNKQGYKPRKIVNDDMSDQDWKVFCEKIAATLRKATKPGAPLYCVMGPSEWPMIDGVLRGGGFHWSSTIIWVKDQLVLSRKDYHTRYEPMWYGWNDQGPRLVKVADRKQDDVWEIDRPKVSELHPTTKPVELIERALKNSSAKGNTVLDTFTGSGSTLIAAERLGRVFRGMEITPIYCDVIVRRWQEFTGADAILEGTDSTYNSLKPKTPPRADKSKKAGKGKGAAPAGSDGNADQAGE